MRSLLVWLVVALAFVAFPVHSANAQNQVTRSQVDALLGAYEDVTPEQWRSVGNAAIPILESIARDQGALPTRRARSLGALAVLRSGEATMRTLAKSDAAPLIVRMSAVQALGQVLPEAALITALSPLLQDTQPQLRGAAAETLSHTPAGCAAVAGMAKLESDAWRARFVRACGAPASGATGATQIPGSADPNAPDALAGTTERIVVYRIVDPTLTKIYDYGSVSSQMKVLLPALPGYLSLTLPNTPSLPLLTGDYKFSVLASQATTADFTALIKAPSTANLTSGTINANLFFVGVPGLNAASARTDANFQAILSNLGSLYAQIGLQLGSLTYIDVTGPDATTYTDVADQTALGAMMKLSISPQASDNAVNLFFVHSISGGMPGYIILGESAGIPGISVRGTTGSGVAVTMAGYPAGLADVSQTIAHETLHWLGLFHTTEKNGTSFDPLGDTPQCPAAVYDTDHNNLVDPVECKDVDGKNLMFWSTYPPTQPPVVPVLTANQQFVAMRNPVVTVTGASVSVAAFFPGFNVSNSTLQTLPNVTVPADAASLTLTGVVNGSLPTARTIVYVRPTATGANNGTSWTDAYTNLQSALAQPGVDIWVAGGVYKPTATADRSITFNVPPHTALYGGFAGTETQLSQRNIKVNRTVLSGDIDNNDAGASGIDADTSQIVGSNSYHVVVMDGTTAAGTIGADTVLDGFTITGGKADGGAPNDSGGGLLCDGSGASHECSATLSNLHFSGNYAAYVGGALHNNGNNGKVSPTVSNTTFSGNYASNAGAVYGFLGDTSAPTFANVTFAGNTATAYGGAIYNYQTSGSASLTMTNVTFSGNVAAAGGGAMAHYNCGAGVTLTSNLTNVIAWGDSPGEVTFVCDTPTFKNSVVQGSGGSGAWGAGFGADGGGNLDADPLLGPLQDNGGNEPTLLPAIGSSAIDAGFDSLCVTAPVGGFDERGVPRPVGTHCDIGAVEYRPLLITSAADPGDGTCDSSCTLRDAITAVQNGVNTVHELSFDASFNTPKTINLTAALPTITKELKINGPGANLLTIRRDTGGDYRIFTVNPSATVTLSGLTIANGKTGFGGGISNFGLLTIDRCTLTGNVGTTNGGAIQNTGVLVVTNSTLSGNSSGHGGGLYNYANTGSACTCSASLTNTTISGNTATSYGGGIVDYNFGGSEPTVSLTNVTIAGNTAPGVIPVDGGGPATIYLQNTIVANNQKNGVTEDLADLGTSPHVISLGNNLSGSDGGGYLTMPGDLINTNPLLTMLGYYGGTTKTVFLKPGSPAIDAGSDAAAPGTDQRAVARPYGVHVDIGAVEWDGTAPVIFQDGFDGL